MHWFDHTHSQPLQEEVSQSNALIAELSAEVCSLAEQEARAGGGRGSLPHRTSPTSSTASTTCTYSQDTCNDSPLLL